VIPTSYTASKAQSVNGSSSTAFCSNLSEKDSLNNFQCNTPDSSVLFDGKLPPLTWIINFDRSWARQLLTAQQNSERSKYVMHFDFTGQPDYAGVGAIEFVVFNCPEWGISLQAVSLEEGTTYTTERQSCASLVTVCFPLQTLKRQFTIEFIFLQWMHLAEIVFYGGYCNCGRTEVSSTSFTISDKCEEGMMILALILLCYNNSHSITLSTLLSSQQR
jgi:hypothetical protein